jgi:PKD repeat protein
MVTADASRSSSAIGIASYLFDFDDGTRTPTTRSTFSHTYCPRGISPGVVKTYQLTVIVTDTAGRQSSASVAVEVTMPVPPVPC